MQFHRLIIAGLLAGGLSTPGLAQQSNPAAPSSLQLDTSKTQGLRVLPRQGLKVFVSAGASPRAAILATRLDKAYRYYNRLLSQQPPVTLLVLSAADHQARYPGDAYGRPFYREGYLVLAAEASPALTAEAGTVKKLSKQPEDPPRIDNYYDLLPTYELTRAYTGQLPGAGSPGTSWLVEFLPLMLQHAYVAQNEPGLMPALETVPRLLSVQDDRAFRHRTLTGFAQTGSEPQNRAWFLAVLATWAPRIYQVDGAEVVRKLYDFLRKSSGESLRVTDAKLAARLEKEVSPTVASIVTYWPAQ